MIKKNKKKKKKQVVSIIFYFSNNKKNINDFCFRFNKLTDKNIIISEKTKKQYSILSSFLSNINFR